MIPSVGGLDGRVFKSSPVIVGSTAPEITEIRLEPTPIHRGQASNAKVVARHPDGEPIKLAFKWFRNGKEVPGAISDTLETKAFRKKDVLAVLVTPSDAKVSGEPKGSAPVTIENGPPGITSLPPNMIEDGQYRYQVIALDPDEDVVRYELRQSPAGMTIDSATGKLVWKLTMESKGKHRVVIVAKDSDNAFVEQDFVIEGQTPTTPPVAPVLLARSGITALVCPNIACYNLLPYIQRGVILWGDLRACLTWRFSKSNSKKASIPPHFSAVATLI